MATRKAIRNTLIYAAVGAGATIAEAALMVLLLWGNLPAVDIFVGHAAICVTLFLWAEMLRRRKGDWRIPSIMAMSTVVMGVVGAGGSLICLFLYAWNRRTATPFGIWYATLFPNTEQDTIEEMRQRLSDPQASTSIGPFMDILRGSGTNQRLAVTALLGRHFRPEFAPALNLALQDHNSAVRTQAANMFTQIEDRYSRRIEELEAEVRDTPDDVDAQLTLARCNEEYAETGILDDERQKEKFEIALETYLRAAETLPGDGEIMAAVGRLFLKEGQYEEAEPWLKDATAAAPGNFSSALLYMETLFHLRRWADLRELSRRYAEVVTEDPNLPPEKADTVALWAAMGPAAAVEGARS